MKNISNQENCTNHYYPNENLCNCYQFIPGPTGPQGVPGIQGPPGIDGATGPTGPVVAF